MNASASPSKNDQSNAQINRELNVTVKRLRTISILMSLYFLFVITPAIALVRANYAGDPNAFSIERMLTAVGIAVFFAVYAQWQMKRLVNFKK
ncbi:hypothetical protein IB286_03575 [Spongiibacter sp. KMU-158]|uniref:Uncharacterized protein n=1 Tax=Spongiibacter pelagi TaxID=2760804 RepID=A0A927BYU2_9GAMM|nr:hypothetical protein [Spongiibacter pelagi]MBD2858075.1 hypothetical protein [Spongiibacter pelagi]